LAHIRHSRIAPSAIIAPPLGFLPPSLGAMLPSEDGSSRAAQAGLQEERVAYTAWKGILTALEQIKSNVNTEDTQESKGSGMTLGD
jgi:hypothetical protein